MFRRSQFQQQFPLSIPSSQLCRKECKANTHHPVVCRPVGSKERSRRTGHNVNCAMLFNPCAAHRSALCVDVNLPICCKGNGQWLSPKRVSTSPIVGCHHLCDGSAILSTRVGYPLDGEEHELNLIKHHRASCAPVVHTSSYRSVESTRRYGGPFPCRRV